MVLSKLSCVLTGAALLACLCAETSPAQTAPYQLYGVDFSPYQNGQSPGAQIPSAQIRQMLGVIAPYTQWVRAYSSLNGIEQVCPIAHQMGLKCAAGAAIYGTSADQQELSGLIAQMQAGYVDLAIVGTEALFRNNVTAATLVNYINQVRSAAPGIPVTTADTYGSLLDNFASYPALLPAMDVVLVNIYPFFENISVENGISWINGWYQLLTMVTGSKQVIISETGWPSGGSNSGPAAPSPVNADAYFISFASWARTNSVGYFYFEAFDEAWKISENTQGPYFGIWDSSGNLKSGRGDVFEGQTTPDTWSGNNLPGGAGTPAVSLSYTPPYGSANQLTGQVLHLRPADYKIGCFIYVSPTWYVKPYASRRLTPIFQDGTWSCSPASTGDTAETKIGAFVFPNGYTPPEQAGGDPPTLLIQNSVANAIAVRTTNAISGVIQDGQGNGFAGVMVSLSGSQNESVVTGSGGMFSFVDLMTGGNYSVAPSIAGAAFSPGSASFANLSGVQTAPFTATSRLLNIYGQITGPDGNALGGAVLSLSGSGISATSDAFGNYTFSGLTPGGSYTVTPAYSGYLFIPQSQSYNGLTSDQTLNFSTATGPPVAAFLDQNGAPALTFDNSTGFPDAGGFLIGAPGVAQAPNGDTYVVGLDSAGGVHLNSYSYANAAWNGWRYSGGILDTTSGLTATIAPNGLVWFTGRDVGNRFWINSWNGNSFGGWILLDQGIFAHDSIPQIAVPGDGSIYVIGKDVGGRIWSNSYQPSNGTFTGWANRQAVMIGQPSVAAGQDGFVYAAVRSVPSASPVYITQIPAGNAGTANTWLNGGGLIQTDPRIAAQGGIVYLTALAGQGTVYVLPFSQATQTYGGWSFTNGTLSDETISAHGGRIYISGRDSAFRIWWFDLTANTWMITGGAGLSSTALTGAK